MDPSSEANLLTECAVLRYVQSLYQCAVLVAAVYFIILPYISFGLVVMGYHGFIQVKKEDQDFPCCSIRVAPLH